MTIKALSDYGELSVRTDGTTQYVLLRNMKDENTKPQNPNAILAWSTRIRVDACEPFEGMVEAISSINPGWFELKLREYAEPFRLSNNWASKYGALKPGEEVEGVINSLTKDTFWLIQRKAKETIIEE